MTRSRPTIDGPSNIRRPGYRLLAAPATTPSACSAARSPRPGRRGPPSAVFIFLGGDDDDTLRIRRHDRPRRHRRLHRRRRQRPADLQRPRRRRRLLLREHLHRPPRRPPFRVRATRSPSAASDRPPRSGGRRSRVYGHGGNDILATFSNSMPAKTLLDGGAGDDQFRLGNDNDMPTSTAVDLRGGEGADAVHGQRLHPHPRRPAAELRARRHRRATRRDLPATRSTAIEAVTLNASSLHRRDHRHARPPSTAFTSTPARRRPRPATSLRLNMAGATGAAFTAGPAAGSGTYTFTNRQPVNYTGVEDAPRARRPARDGACSSAAPRGRARTALAGGHPPRQRGRVRLPHPEQRPRQTLPWSNLNQVSVRFSEHVNVAADDFVLNGVNLAQYGLSTTAAQAFTYDPVTFTATWTLARFIPNDKVTVRLDAAEGTGVTDGSGNRLDGEPANFVTHNRPVPQRRRHRRRRLRAGPPRPPGRPGPQRDRQHFRLQPAPREPEPARQGRLGRRHQRRRARHHARPQRPARQPEQDRAGVSPDARRGVSSRAVSSRRDLAAVIPMARAATEGSRSSNA